MLPTKCTAVVFISCSHPILFILPDQTKLKAVLRVCLGVSVLFSCVESTSINSLTCSKVCLKGWLMRFENWCTLPRKKKVTSLQKRNTEEILVHRSCTLYINEHPLQSLSSLLKLLQAQKRQPVFQKTNNSPFSSNVVCPQQELSPTSATEARRTEH